jgi:hypothetical protein
MRTLGDLSNSAQRIDLLYLVSLALVESAEDYVRLQREQMMSGLREDGRPIYNVKSGSDTYSPSYAKKKGKSKPIDLYNTGAFQSNIFLHSDNADKFVVDSADSKSAKLQENYSTRIFGLDQDNKVQLIPIVRQYLVEELQKELSK